MTTPLDKERLEALREQYDYDRFCCSCDGCKLEFVFPQMADTIDALLRVRDIAVRMTKRMKLINGTDDKCILPKLGECANHTVIHEMEEALQSLNRGEA